MVTARLKIRNITTQAAKRRLLKNLDDDTLLGFLIDAAQDANDPRVSRYEKEDEDLQEIIIEILTRMDAAKNKEFEE